MNITVVTLLLFFYTLKSSQSEENVGKNNESLLLNTIFKDYNKRVRPVKNYRTPVAVLFGIQVKQILQVDEKHQVLTTNILRYIIWKDEFLQWRPEIYENIANMSLSRNQIWTPDIQLFNSASFDKEEADSPSSTKILVKYNGSVLDVMPMIVSTCEIDVTWFPFDEQKCFLVFGSWTSTSKQLQLSEGGEDIVCTMGNGEWRLLGITFISSFANYSCCPDDKYFRINYTIHLKRRPFYYFFNLIVPCGLIGFLAILGFTLPPESGEKLTLGATLLFSLIVFLNMISESMPANSDTVPLLGTYFNCVMFTIALSVVSTIVVNVNMKAVNPKKLDGFSKKFFLRWLPRIFRMTVSSKIVAEQDEVLSNKKTVEETNKIVTQQWNLVAVVVDRICLVLSLIVTILSVTVFIIYAYK